MISYYYRREMATPDKVDGGDNPGELINKKSKPYKDSDDGSHYGKPEAVIMYDGNNGEFYCRIDIQGRPWNFRALSVEALRSQVERFFAADRARIKFKLSRAADLARFGEHAAIGRL
jgi:hypothetical protein